MSNKNALKARFVVTIGFMAMMLTQCTAPPEKKYGRKLPRDFERKLGSLTPTGIQDSLATPPHNFSREDYPFDASGNYREDWVRAGSPSRPSKKENSRLSSSSAASGRRYHVVKSGETMFSLSRQYGTTLHALRKENNMSTYSIRSGQVLKIPRD